MRGGGERSGSNIQGGNIQTITNIQAIEGFIDKQIHIKTPGAAQQKTQGGGNALYGKGPKNTATRAIT